VGCAPARSFSNACKNFSRQHPLGAEIWSFEKVDLGGSESAHSSVLLVNQSSADFFFAERGRNRCRSHVFPILDISISSRDICDCSLNFSEVDPNFVRFWPQLFGGGPPKFWDIDYQIQEPSDHVAKFRGGRPTEFGDLALKEEGKTSAVKHKAVGIITVPGGLTRNLRQSPTCGRPVP